MNWGNLLKTNLRKKITASIIIFILIIGGLIYFVFIPTIRDIKKIRDEINAQRIDLENKYLKGKSLKKLSRNLKKIGGQGEELERVFINQGRALEFITTLEGVAGNHGIAQKINLLPSQNIKESQIYKKIPIQIAAVGNFADEVRYLTDLEALSYYINIESLELSTAPLLAPSPEEGTGGNVNLLIVADTYWK